MRNLINDIQNQYISCKIIIQLQIRMEIALFLMLV